MSKEERNLWSNELHSKFVAGVSWTFLLHFNVVDFVKPTDGIYKNLKRYLVEDMLSRRQMIVFYDRSRGIHFFRPEAETQFINLLNLKPLSGQKNVVLPRDPSFALPLLEKFLKITPEIAAKRSPNFFKKDRPFGALIIGFTETIVPDGAITSQSSDDRTSIVTISRWARDMEIEDSGNIIIMMTQNKEDVSRTLRGATSNIESIMVSLPDVEQRSEFIKYLFSDAKFKKPELGITPEQFVSHTSGLALVSIEDIIKRAAYDNSTVDADYIWENKKSILENMGAGLIEICKPKWGFNVIGDLDIPKNYLRNLAKAVRRGDVLSIPMGILLLGAPGTGKSIIVEAFAKEIGFALVKLKPLRDQFVGVSERNQEFVFQILKALAPVVVFEDEIEGKQMARGTYWSGDSGVTARMSARRREFMSDTKNRGDIIWISATNRPDLMDTADLREGRYDVRIPFTIPKTADVRVDIFKAILTKMSIEEECRGRKFKYAVSKEELCELAEKEKMNGSTGAEIESICRRAYEICCICGDKDLNTEHLKEAIDDFITSRDHNLYEYMQQLAFQLTNFKSLIPEEYRKEAERARELSETIRKKKKELFQEKEL